MNQNPRLTESKHSFRELESHLTNDENDSDISINEDQNTAEIDDSASSILSYNESKYDEIDSLIDSYKDLKYSSTFHGVFDISKIPKNIEKAPICILVNSDKRLFEEHWISIYISKNNTRYFYDPEGLPPNQPELCQFLNNNTNS